jgi:hypothetical protein
MNAWRQRNKLEYGPNNEITAKTRHDKTLCSWKTKIGVMMKEEEDLAWTIWKIAEESYHTRNAVT